MGKKIHGVIVAVTGAFLAVGTAGAMPATQADGQIAAGKSVKTADATTQPKVKQGATAVSPSTATDVKVKKGATPSTPTKMELGSQNPTVKKGATVSDERVAYNATPTVKHGVKNPNVKSGATPGGSTAVELIKR